MLQHTKLVSTWKGSCKPFCTIMPLTFLLNFFLHNHASYILASCFYAENSDIFNTFTWTWPDFFQLLCSFLFAALGYPFTNCCVHTYHHLHVNYRLSPPREWPEPVTFYHCARILVANIPRICRFERYCRHVEETFLKYYIRFIIMASVKNYERDFDSQAKSRSEIKIIWNHSFLYIILLSPSWRKFLAHWIEHMTSTPYLERKHGLI